MWVLWTCLNKSVNWCERGAALLCAIGFTEHYSMVKAADILLAAPSVHGHIYLHVTSVPKTWPLTSRINRTATWAPDPFTSPFQILTVAFNLCKPIPSSVINTHMEHKHGGVSQSVGRVLAIFQYQQGFGFLSVNMLPTMSSHVNRWVPLSGSSPLPLTNLIISSQKWCYLVFLIQPNPLNS